MSLSIIPNLISVLHSQVSAPSYGFITPRSVELDYSPAFGFQGSIRVQFNKTYRFKHAEVEEKFIQISNLKEKLLKLDSKGREAYFLSIIDVEVKRLPNQNFKVILSHKKSLSQSSPETPIKMTGNSNQLPPLEKSPTKLVSKSNKEELKEEKLDEPSISLAMLNAKFLADQPAQIRSFAERIIQEPRLKDFLFDIVEKSKNNKSISTASSNAISILAAAGLNLSNRNFKGISIPGAVLSNSIMTNTDISHADLRGVSLNNAFLDNTTFAHSNLEGLRLGQQPFLKIPSLALNDNISRLIVSSDGKLAALANANTIQIWELGSGKEFYCKKVNGEVHNIAFSPDSKWVLSGEANYTLRMWDWETGKERFCLQGTDLTEYPPANPKINVGFSTDGQWILMADGYSLHLFNSLTGKKELKFHTSCSNGYAISQDNSHFLTVNDYSVNLLKWEDVNKYPSPGLEIREKSVKRAIFSPDGKMVATAGNDKRIRFWNSKNGHEEMCLIGHFGTVNCVVFSPDGKMLLSGSDDKTVRLWNAETGHEIYCFCGHQEAVKMVWFSQDGKLAISGSRDEIIRRWTISEIENIQRKKESDLFERVIDMSISNDGKKILIGAPLSKLLLLESQTGKPLAIFKDVSILKSVALSSNGEDALVSCFDQTIRIIDCKQRVLTGTINAEGEFYNPGFSPKGEWILCQDERIILIDNEAKKGRIYFEGHSGRIRSFAVSSDSKWMLSGGYDKTVRLWNFETGDQVHCFNGHSRDVNRVAFSLNGHWAVSGSDDKTVRLWDCCSGKEVFCMLGHHDDVTHVEISADGRWIVSGSSDNSVRLWDIRSGKETYCLPLRGEVIKAHLLPNGKELLVATCQPALQLWTLFDKEGHFKPSLSRTSHSTFSAYNINLEGAIGLCETNSKVLQQHYLPIQNERISMQKTIRKIFPFLL